MKQNPFSFYDFLGYLFPGLFALILFGICAPLYINAFTFPKAENFITNIIIGKTPFNPNIDTALILIIFAYILGHLIAFVSSITIEVYMNWIYGYPSQYLFSEEFFWINPKCSGWHVACFIFLSFLMFPISIFIWLFKLISYRVYKSNNELFFPKRFKKNQNLILNKRLFYLFQKLHIFYEVNCLRKKHNIKDFTQDDFRVLASYIYQTDSQHVIKMNNYVALYGFLRAITLILCAFSLMIFVKILIGPPETCQDWHTYYGILILIFCSFISFIFFLAFVKFYRRYSVEAINGLLTTDDL